MNASMRPRRIAAEYDAGGVRCTPRQPGFNEAAANRRGIPAWVVASGRWFPSLQ